MPEDQKHRHVDGGFSRVPGNIGLRFFLSRFNNAAANGASPGLYGELRNVGSPLSSPRRLPVSGRL